MKSKKAFTLIEVIISISLIVIIGISTTILFVKKTNNKKEKEIEKVTQVLQNAASIYLSVNKDDNVSILENIQNGGSGYVIPIKTLLKEGYITDAHIETLQKNNIDIDLSKDYMLAAVFSESNQACTNGDYVIEIEPSYKIEKGNSSYYLCNFTKQTKYLYYDLNGGYFNDYSVPFELKIEGTEVTVKDGSNVTKKDESSFSYTFDYWSENQECDGNNKIDSNTNFNLTENKVIYACYKKDVIQKELTLKEMMNSAKFSNNIGKAAISREACIANGIDPKVGNDNVVCNENGLFLDRDKANGITYYYFRGAVENNYVNFAGKLWRILWINSNNEAKLIIDDAVDLVVQNQNYQNITLKSDDSISYMHIIDIQNRPNDSVLWDRDNSRKIPRSYYILHRNDSVKNISTLFSSCSTAGADCTLPNGTNYKQKPSETYQNLNKSDFLNSYGFGGTDVIQFDRTNVIKSDIYI